MATEEYAPSELRKRNTSSAATENSSSKAGAETKKSQVTVSSIKDQAEVALGILIQVLQQLGLLYDAAYPHLEKYFRLAQGYYATLEPYHPELLLPTLIGIVLCFFGGDFVLVISAVEAYRVAGWSTTRQCIVDLIADFQAVAEASKKDDSVDDNKDGVADVKQISTKELFNRKMLIFIQTIDPKRFTDSITGLNHGFLAVVATLKLEFCKALTLGGSICDCILPPILKISVPLIASIPAIHPAYHKWIPIVLTYVIKYIVISCAFFLQRIVSALHSSIRGGLMIARNLLQYLKAMKLIDFDDKETYIDEIAGYCLAFFGFYFQLRMAFRLPFPLNVLLFPVTIAESFLTWAVSA